MVFTSQTMRGSAPRPRVHNNNNTNSNSSNNNNSNNSNNSNNNKWPCERFARTRLHARLCRSRRQSSSCERRQVVFSTSSIPC